MTTNERWLKAAKKALDLWERKIWVDGRWELPGNSNECPLCKLSDELHPLSCEDCPLFKVGAYCEKQDSPWYTAQQVYPYDKLPLIAALKKAVKYCERQVAAEKKKKVKK